MVFGDAGRAAAQIPAVYTFEYTQSDYAEIADVATCDGSGTAGANLTEIDGNCYPTIAIDMPDGERRDVVERDRTNQRYYAASEDLAAVLSADVPSRSVGVILTDAALNVSDLGVYRLNADGVLEDAGDFFDNYFTLVANNSYAVNAGAAGRPALVISQNVLAELNSSALPSGEEYLSLDTLELNTADPMRDIELLCGSRCGRDGRYGCESACDCPD